MREPEQPEVVDGCLVVGLFLIAAMVAVGFAVVWLVSLI